MKIFQLQFCQTKNIQLKKKLLILIVLPCLFHLNAQEKNNVKLKLEPGVLLKIDSENLGLLLNAEPNIKISESGVIGLRFGLAVNSQKFENNNNSQFRFDKEADNAIISFVPTFDYYLNQNYTRPYLGLGLGYYVVSAIALVNPSENVGEGSANNQVGLLLRGGLEWRRTKFGLEYNFIPKADIKIPDGQTIGTVDGSYFGLSIGFIIGGGKPSI